MPVPKIALATSQTEGPAPGQVDPHEILTPSENLLIEALTDAGACAIPAIWSDPKADWRQFAAVVIRTCWDYHLRVEEFLVWIGALEEKNVQVINHPDLIRWNSDKRYLRDFAAKNIAIPETVWIGPDEEANVAEICAYATERRKWGQVRGPKMIQQYLPAIETEGEWSLVYFDHQYSHAVRKRPRASDFRVQKDHGGRVEVDIPGSSLTHFAETALRELPHPATFARVDLVEQDGKIYLMELEVIEPELFLNYAPGSAQDFAGSILKRLAPGTEAQRKSCSLPVAGALW